MALDMGVARGYLELDITNFDTAVTAAEKGLRAIEQKSKLTESEMRLLSGSSQNAGTAFQQAAAKSQILSGQLEAARQKSSLYRQAVQDLNGIIARSAEEQKELAGKILETASLQEKAGESARELAGTYEALRQEQESLERAAELYRGALGEESGEYKTAQAAADRHQKALEAAKEEYDQAEQKSRAYKEELSRLEDGHREAEREIERSRDTVTQLQTALLDTEDEMRSLEGELSNTQNKVKLWGQEFQKAGDKVEAAGKKISEAGGFLTDHVTAPLLEAGKSSVTLAAEAETSFAKVGTVVDEAELSYERMRSGVLSASNETGAAVTDFNEALYAAVTAGIKSGDAISFTGEMVKLAKGGFTDTGKAVDVVTAALGAYGLGAEDASVIADKLITTQRLGRTTVDELAGSLGEVLPTAGAFGVSIDDVAAAMADLTKNGMETGEAASSYNSMLEELGASGSKADAALKELAGKGFTELVKEGKPLTEILGLLEESAQANEQSLSDLFGSAEAGKAALTIMKDGGSEYNGMLQDMEKSAGAAQKAFDKMDSTPASKMQKELNKLKNAGIDVGNKLLPLVTKGVEFIGKLADAYESLSPEQQDMIVKLGLTAAAAGPVIKTVGGVTEGIGGLARGIGGLARGIGGLLSGAKGAKTPVEAVAKAVGGVGTQAATASGGLGVVKGVLGALAGPAGIATIAGVAIVGVGTALYHAYQEAKKNDLAEHFGDIKLSAEEVEDVAERLTTTDWTVKITAYANAKETLDEMETSLESTIAELNKTSWKVSIGLELTEAEKQNYISNTESFVQDCTDYVAQKGYTVNLAIKASFQEGSATGAGLSAFSDSYYADAYDELNQLGEELAQLVNDSFANNTFAQNRVRIDQIRSQMAELKEEIAQGELAGKKLDYEMELGRINLDLTAESYKSLNESINKNVEELQKDIDAAKAETKQNIQLRYDLMKDAGMDESAEKLKDQAVKELEADMAASEMEWRLTGVRAGLDPLLDNYSESLEKAKPDFDNRLQETLGQLGTDIDFSSGEEFDFSNFFFSMESRFANGVDGFEIGQKENIRDCLASMGDQPEALAELAQTFLSAGQTIPQSMSEGLSDLYEMELMAGNIDHIYEYMGMQLGNSPEYLDLIAEAKKNGYEIPDGLISGMEMSSGKLYDATTNTWKEVETASIDVEKEIIPILQEQGLKPGDILADSMASQFGLVYNNGQWLSAAASDGLASEIPNVLNTFGQSGIDIPNSLISSLSGKSAEVQNQAAGLLNQLLTATESEKPGILASLKYLGIDGADELSTNMKMKQGEVEEAARNLAILIGSATDEERPALLEKMHSLGIDLTDEQIAALQSQYGDVDAETRTAAQNYINGFDETIQANGGSSETVISGWTQGIFDALLKGLDEHSPSQQTKDAGKNYTLGFNSAIDQGRKASNNIIKAWASGMYDALNREELPSKSKKIGTDTADNLINTVTGKAFDARIAGRSLAQSAVNGIQSVNRGMSWDWGWDLGQGLASGLWASQSSVASAAYSVAATVRSYLHFSRPDVGPLRDYETYMPDFMEGLAKTMRRSRPVLEREAFETASMLRDSMEPLYDPELLWEAAGSIDRRFTADGIQIIQMQIDEGSIGGRMDAMGDDLSALRGEIQSLSKTVQEIQEDGINGDSIALGVADAMSKATFRATVDKRQAGSALAPEIDKNQGRLMALRKRGV